MSRLGQGSDTTACPWCEGNIDPSGGYFSKLDDNHKSHNSQGFTIFSQFSRSPGRLLNHEWARKESRWLLNHERHERHEKLRTTNGHERARMNQTTKDTKHTKKTQNHEWTRMDTNGLYHEWTRMGTNGLNHERHEKLRTTNGHEWTRKESRGLLNHEWARISVVRGLLPSLACGLSSTVDGMQCAISSQFAHLPSGESRDGVGILVVDGVSAARCERSTR